LAGSRIDQLRTRVADPEQVQADPFRLLADVSRAYSLAESTGNDADLLEQARELIILLTEHRHLLGPASSLHDSLLSKIGLYPYLDDTDLSGTDLFAYEAHRPPGDFGDGFVWHSQQARAYALLMDGHNVILSAPTSFGKSRIIDGVLATRDLSSVVVIVPTIALIDETRRRLSRLLGSRYKIVTHAGQPPSKKTIYVLTQERLLELDELPPVDLFVIDEFYKLAIAGEHEDDDRMRLLNLAFYRLLQTGAQFYLLGPRIGDISEHTLSRLECAWIDSRDTTVAVEVIKVPKGGRKPERLRRVCKECAERNEPTLIYCASPKKAEAIGLELAEAGLGVATELAPDAADWMAHHYHPRWRVSRAVRSGVGVHHGQLPRALGHYMVSAFDRGEINFLVCTPTLIEGVNTKAKNVVVFDHTIGNRTPLDLFTFNNIRGRTGRMSNHISGRVYVFKDPPEPPLHEIDIPILSQSEEAPADLFLSMPADDIEPSARQRLETILDGAPISATSIKATPAVKIGDQLRLAEAIQALPPERAALLSWGNAYPRAEQSVPIFELVLDEVFADDRRRNPFGAFSASQLVKWIQLLEDGDTRELIANQVAYAEQKGYDPDDSILSVLKFLRSGLSFEAPRWLRAIDAIQRELLPRVGISAGDYGPYIARLENLFLPQPLAALDEYGVPIELIRKLSPLLAGAGEELDAVLGRLASLDADAIDLDPFERLLLRGAQDGLVTGGGSDSI
jgi:hypothetical protein